MWIRSRKIFDRQAQLPTVEKRPGSFRIFYSYRVDGRSHINYFDLNENLDVIYENENPVLEPGERGCFDDKGVMPSCLLGQFLYYTGWNTDKGLVPYGHGIGLAVWDEHDNCFKRVFRGPILDRGINTPFLVNSPYVSRISSGLRMWFCNGLGWDGEFPKYNICSITAKSVTFQKPMSFSREVGYADEACSRPFVYSGKIYFSKRTKDTDYEIYSYNGSEIVKELAASEEGWDSQMVCYPYIVGKYMFYNGNGYGTTGIGVAECTKN